MPSMEAEEKEKPKEEPKPDARKTTSEGGYTIPAQMY
jgi:hypothetical protein